jgi:AraC family transcriptional regulator
MRLSQGNFFGKVLATRKVGDFLLNETVYFPQEKVPRHSHEDGYFCLVRRGSYTEAYGRRRRSCGPFTFAFHPPGEVHSEMFDDREVRSFNIEITRAWLGRMGEYSLNLNGSAEFRGGPGPALALKLYREFLSTDSASRLAIEGLILEIVAQASRQEKRLQTKKPTWLSRVREILHERFAEGLSLSDIARLVDVHPVHMATAFKRHFHSTIGEYIRHLRIEYACRELGQSSKSLAEIAASSGFADQSHLSRVLKSRLGMTPAECRAHLRLNEVQRP